MKRFLAFLGLALATVVANAQSKQTVILGEPKAQSYAGELNCSPDFCMDGFVVWTIRLNRQLSGPPAPGVIRAVQVQHAAYVFREHHPVRLFVLSTISDPAMRERFKADYLIESWASPPDVFCVVSKLDSASFDDLEEVGQIGGQQCYRPRPG